MAFAPPLSHLSDVAPITQQATSVEAHLADFVAALVEREENPASIIMQLFQMSRQAAAQKRDEMGAVLHNTARSILIKSAEDQLNWQADTWLLLHHLYCRDCPASFGGPRPHDTGDVLPRRQLAVNIVATDPDLDKRARVVAWLEALAAEKLKPEGFAQGEGLPMYTRSLAGNNSVPLDPDAPLRLGSQLAAEDAATNDRIMKRTWDLILAGKLDEALQLLNHVGQAWRAAELAVGGQWGPLPVGAAAGRQNEAWNVGQMLEELAAELHSGPVRPVAAWKWSLLHLSSGTDTTHKGLTHEQAVYGALCGNLEAMLPACRTWYDTLWAHARAGLDLRTDLQLHHATEDPDTLVDYEMEGPELVDLFLNNCREEAASLDPQAGLEAMAAAQRGAWPLPELLDSVLELEQVLTGGLPEVKPEHEKHHRIQARLIMAQHNSLAVEELQDAVSACPEWALLPPMDPAAPNSRQYLLLRFAVHLVLLMRALGVGYEDEVVERGGEGGDLEMAGEIVEGPDGGEVVVVRNEARFEVAAEKLLSMYTAYLIELNMPELVPLYAVHCTAFKRREVLAMLLRSSTVRSLQHPPSEDDPLAEAQCLQVFQAVVDACEGALRRQQNLEAARLGEREEAALEQGLEPSQLPDLDPLQLPPGFQHFMHTKIGPAEVQELLEHVACIALADVVEGPLWRTRVLRWLFYPFLQLADLDAAEASAQGEPEWAMPAHTLAMQQALRLLRWLTCSLDDPASATAAELLWREVVPPDFLQWLHGRLLSWEEAVQAEREAGGGYQAELELQNVVVQMAQAAELHRLLTVATHLEAAARWRAGGAVGRTEVGLEETGEPLDQLEAGAQLVAQAVGLLDDPEAVQLLAPPPALLQAALDPSQPPGFRIQLVTSGGPLAPADSTAAPHAFPPYQEGGSAYTFPALQGSQASLLEEQLEDGIEVWLQEVSGGKPSCREVATRLSLHTADARTTVLLELQTSNPSEAALEQMVSLAAATLGGHLPGAVPRGLMVVHMEASPDLEALLTQRLLAGRLLLEVQDLRLQLLAQGAAEDAGKGLVPQLAEAGSALGQVAMRVPREVMARFNRMEAQVELAVMRLEEARCGVHGMGQ